MSIVARREVRRESVASQVFDHISTCGELCSGFRVNPSLDISEVFEFLDIGKRTAESGLFAIEAQDVDPCHKCRNCNAGRVAPARLPGSCWSAAVRSGRAPRSLSGRTRAEEPGVVRRAELLVGPVGSDLDPARGEWSCPDPKPDQVAGLQLA